MSQTSEVHPSVYRQKNVPMSVQIFPARKNSKYLTLLAKLNKCCVSNLSIRVTVLHNKFVIVGTICDAKH